MSSGLNVLFCPNSAFPPSSENYLLHFASSGQRALDRLDIFHPDLILLDVMMPDLDGIEVCRRIRALSQWQVVPISCSEGESRSVLSLVKASTMMNNNTYRYKEV